MSETMGIEIATIVRDYVRRATETLAADVQALSLEQAKALKDEQVQRVVDAAVATWALGFERKAMETLHKMFEAVPKPRDALEIKDFELEVEEDGRTIVVKLGDTLRRARTALVLDRGVFKDGQSYAKGDAVSWGGSLWIAQADSPAGKPGTTHDWRLAVKAGRDAK